MTSRRYAGTFIVSVGNGAAQAIADPVVASMYRHNKTTWLHRRGGDRAVAIEHRPG